MEPSPAGNPRRRLVEPIRRFLSSVSFSHWTRIAVALLLIMPGSSTIVRAQEEDPVEWALELAMADRSLLLDAAAVDGMLVVVGERGHILISNDAGKTWRQAKVPTRATLTGVWFHDPSHGWAVGHDSVILRTMDGGATWERVQWAPDDESPFLDVWFFDAESGFAIGAYGSFFVTEDGGATWFDEMIGEDDFHLNHMARSDTGRMYIAAEAGAAYRSDDDGATWTILPTPYEGSFFGVLPLDGDALLLFGLRGHLFRSDDAGETWTTLETGTTAMLNSGIRLEDGRIVIAGLGGVVLVSDDGGRSFDLRGQSSRAGIQTLVDAGDGQLLLVGEFGIRMLPLKNLSDGKDE